VAEIVTEADRDTDSEIETEAEAEAEVEAEVGRIAGCTKNSDVWAEIPVSGVAPIGGLSIGVGFTENTDIEPKGGATEETFE
jgi:hypothetical protein